MYYNFEKTKDIKPINNEFEIANPNELYDRLMKVWSIETCAPRLRSKWSSENRTVGQCSITSFLVQDIFAGEVYGVPLAEGGLHCFNVIDGVMFDLTNEQFDKPLTYTLDYPQNRNNHFSSKEKYERYILLKQNLKKTC